MQIFLISLPIFLIVLSGWLLRRARIADGDWVHTLNYFAYYVSLPALIVVSFWDVNFLEKESWSFISMSVITLIIFSAIVFVILSLFNINKSVKTAIFLSATTGNTIYMALPLIETAFGKGRLSMGALAGVIYLVLPLLISIFIIRYWHNRSHRLINQLKDFLKNPLVISVVIGVLISLWRPDYDLFIGIKKALTMLGATASPIALFALGGFLSNRFLKKDLREAFFVSFLKMILFTFVVFVIGYFTNSENTGLLALLSSMPVAVTTFVIAEKFDLNKDLVGNSIVISTIFSFVIAPLVIYLF